MALAALRGSRPVCLPLELYRPIIGELDSPEDICSVARVSRHLQLESEKFLYESAVVESIRSCIAFMKRVSACSRRALLVRSLQVEVDFEDNTPSISFLRLLSRGLEQLKNLRDLRLIVHELFSEDLSGSWILDRCTFKLHYLHCNFSVPDHSLLSFLQRQDGLTHLQLWVNGFLNQTDGALLPETYCVSPSFLPNLVALTAIDVDAFRLILTRPITHLAVLSALWSQSDWRAGFKAAGVTLKALCLRCPISAEDLAEISNYVPKLELFSMSNPKRTQPIDHLFRALNGFKELQQFEANHWFSEDYNVPVSDLLKRFTDSCPSLRTIALHNVHGEPEKSRSRRVMWKSGMLSVEPHQSHYSLYQRSLAGVLDG